MVQPQSTGSLVLRKGLSPWPHPSLSGKDSLSFKSRTFFCSFPRIECFFSLLFPQLWWIFTGSLGTHSFPSFSVALVFCSTGEKDAGFPVAISVSFPKACNYGLFSGLLIGAVFLLITCWNPWRRICLWVQTFLCPWLREILLFSYWLRRGLWKFITIFSWIILTILVFCLFVC